MGKAQKKTGKGRLDKYYKLAKEQGYRARSAFKLIQLNKKYSFLETARCCIDLCAAPGGWLQVASKYMPSNSVIVGVDLVPIKPIPRVVTFASDITTTQCRNLIRNELKDWRADVVLHDGAPNVGTAWIQDAYSQSELVLMSLKLAVDFLVKGGTFVTKVFRSADYNNLIWVFNQLFAKVEATKPPSSRNVSAEIFVVCRDFLAPKFIDPKFLDPKHVFKDLAASVASGTDKGSSSHNAQANVFQPEKSRRKRDGYDEGDYTLFKAVPVGDFIRNPDPISVLGAVANFGCHNGDIKANCDDLKVLGKGDFKALLKWRSALREELGLENKTKGTDDATEVVEVTEEVDEEEQIQEELERLNKEKTAREKRERRRANEIKTRTIQRMQLSMTAPLEIGLEQQDLSLGGQDFFDLGGAEIGLRKRGGVSALGDEDDASTDDGVEGSGDEDESVLDSDEERQRKVASLEAEMDGLYDSYRDRLRERDAKFKVKEAREKNADREEWHGIQEKGDSDSEDEGNGGWEKMEDVKNQDDDSSSDDSDDDVDGEPARVSKKRSRPERETTKPVKRARLVTKLEQPRAGPSTQAAKVWFSQDIFADVDEEIDDDAEMSVDDEEIESADGNDEDDAEDNEEDDDDFEIVPAGLEDDSGMWDVDDENEDEIKQEIIKSTIPLTLTYRYLTIIRARSQHCRGDHARTTARQPADTKTQLLNDGFNRYSLNSKEGLPDWFLDEESKFYKPNLPVTKEAMAALRAKQRALDARPIKKVAEAKARKKFKAAQRLEKAMKKAEGVNETTDLSEREKAQQIEKLMRKGMSSGTKVKKEIKLVVAKGSHKGIKGRPKGVKGRYTMVDSRMKKEVRAKKRAEKANKKRKRA
ncbi:unnamed protein product [Mycena citricolor]|uniref:AdoMet-dependent rRNA methyltransferase SPB1 n=1 Tax=Mycena citricolor TaxID=2018698 RepID=A0AAD2HRY8_9AGAR|nr:unnamed protein product [Mycena citricolor]